MSKRGGGGLYCGSQETKLLAMVLLAISVLISAWVLF